MADRTLTSADLQFMLTLPGLFPIAQQIQGFASDDAFAIEPYDLAETLMGVDGQLSGGYTPNPKKQAIQLQANSVSNDIFDIWRGAQESTKGLIVVTATIQYPALGKTYAMNRGFLTRVQAIAPAKKILQPQTYEITWQDVQSSILS